MKKRKISKFIYWTPRILSILFLCFLALFSLDVITPGASFLEILGGLFMHNIPVLILATILWISWKKEIVGAIAFLLVGFLYIFNIVLHSLRSGSEGNMVYGGLIIFVPALIIGIFFLINHLKKKSI